MTVSRLDAWALTSNSSGNLGSRTVSAGTDRLLVYVVAEESGSREPTSVQYGGQEMTQAVLRQSGGGFPISGSIWYLNDAGIQAATDSDFTATFDQVTHNGQYRAATAVYDGVDQATPLIDSDSSLDDTLDNTTTAADLTLTTEQGGFGIWLWVEGGSDATVDASLLGLEEQLEVDASSIYLSIADTTTDGTDLTGVLTGGSGIDRNVQVAVTLAAAVQTVELDQPQEADSALAVTPVGTNTVTIGVTSETDSAFVVSPIPSGNVGVEQSEETDTAQSIAPAKSIPVGLAEEQDFGQIILDGAANPTALLDDWRLVTSSTVSALAGVTFVISAGSNRMLIVAIAEDSSVGKPTGVTYGGVSMTPGPLADTGGGFPTTSQFFILNEAGIQAAATNNIEVQGVEVHNGAFRLFASSYENVGQTGFRDSDAASDTGEVAGPLTIESSGRSTSFSLITNSAAGLDFDYTNANEILSDNGQGISASIAEQVTDGSDVTFEPFTPDSANNTALTVISMKGVDRAAILDQASETDSALATQFQSTVQVGAAAEVDTAQAVVATNADFVQVGQASEADTALEVTPFVPGRVQVGQATEADTTLAIGIARAVEVSRADETDTAQAVAIARQLFVDTAIERDAATLISIFGQEAAAALERRNTAGAADYISEAELEAKRLGAMRRAIEREDEEIMAALPAMVKSLLNLQG